MQVTDELDDGRRVVNPVETAARAGEGQAMQERFAEWCWEDPDRARRLLGEYNRRFNSIVLRDYAPEGERLTLPGWRARSRHVPTSAPRSRGCCREPAVGLFHQVGAGKTAEMVIGVTELRRLGMVRKPVPGGPEPHARPVQPRVAAALPASADPGRLQRGPRRREAPAVRRAGGGATTGTRS